MVHQRSGNCLFMKISGRSRVRNKSRAKGICRLRVTENSMKFSHFASRLHFAFIILYRGAICVPLVTKSMVSTRYAETDKQHNYNARFVASGLQAMRNDAPVMCRESFEVNFLRCKIPRQWNHTTNSYASDLLESLCINSLRN